MPTKLLTFLGAITVAAGLSLLTAGWAIPSDATRFWNAIAAFAVLCFLAEAYSFRFRVGRTEAQSSVAFIPYIAAFLLFDSAWACLVTGASMIGVEFGVRRKPGAKIAFNTAQVVLAIRLASLAFQDLGGIPSVDASVSKMPWFAVVVGIAL